MQRIGAEAEEEEEMGGEVEGRREAYALGVPAPAFVESLPAGSKACNTPTISSPFKTQQDNPVSPQDHTTRTRARWRTGKEKETVSVGADNGREIHQGRHRCARAPAPSRSLTSS
eukprot:3114007-Rhodomonas_salina.1